jgi:glycosyltransferase involved in cell wall biosynthesis
MKPLVSILIPAYNAERWIAETIESAIAQSWERKEIIVVDDGSADDTLAVARRFEGSGVKVVTQSNSGGNVARNRALREAQGDFIQYLDADDLMLPGKMSSQLARLEREPPSTLASSAWDRFYSDPNEASFPVQTGWTDFDRPLDWLILAGHTNAMMAPHCWLVPRDVVEKAGPWNEQLRINQDGEYFARVAMNSTRIAFCPEARALYRSGIPGSVSRRRSPAVLASLLLSYDLITSLMLEAENSPECRSACAAYYQRFAFLAWPDVPELVWRAEARVAELGGSDLRPEAGPQFKRAIDILGWRKATALRRLLRRETTAARAVRSFFGSGPARALHPDDMQRKSEKK